MLTNKNDPFALTPNNAWVTSFSSVKGKKSIEINPKDVDEDQPPPKRSKREKNH